MATTKEKGAFRLWLSPWIIAGLTLLLGLSVTLKIAFLDAEHRVNDARSRTLSQLATVRAHLEAAANAIYSETSGMVNVIRYQGGISPDLFHALAAETIKDQPQIRSVAVAPDNVVTMVHPVPGNEKVLGLRYETIPEQYRTVLQAMRSRSPVLTGPLKLVQGGEGFILRAPVFTMRGAAPGKGSRYWGIVSIVAKVDVLLDAGGVRSASGLDIALRRGEAGSKGVLIWGSEAVFSRNPVSMEVVIPGEKWHIAAVPKGGWPGPGLAADPTLYFGLTNSLLLAVLAWAAASRHRQLQIRNRQLVESQQILEHERSRLRILLQTIPALVWMKSPEGVYLACNSRFERFFGAGEREILGKTDYDFVEPALADAFRANDRKAIAAGGPSVNEEWVTYADDGHRELLETIKTPVHDGEGKLIGVLGIARDITVHRQMEEDLQKERLRFKNLVDSVDGIVWEMDADCFAFTYVSGQAERILGYPVREWFDPGFWAAHLHPEDRQWVPTSWPGGNPWQVGRGIEIEFRCLTRDGRTVWLHNIVTVVEEEGRPRWLRGIMVDTTGKKLEEKEKQKLEAQLRQAQKMEAVGRLAGGVAHDFNNKLLVILGFAELAEHQCAGSEKLRNYLTEIIRAASQSSEITRQLLAFSRREVISPRVLDLNEVVRSSQQGLCRFIGEDIRIELRLAPDLWPIKMDPTQVDQILMNLAVNARDAMPDGGRLEVETRNVTMASDQGATGGATEYVQLTVSDTGCGIDQEGLQHVFEPFYTTKPTGKGTGLGLATVYGIVTQNRGTVRVASEPGAGTVFRICFPHCEQGASAAECVEAARGMERSATILLVEDEPSVRYMTATMLEQMGYATVVAEDPRQAIELCSRQTPRIDLLLTDVIMPEMNGRELSRQIEALQPGIKVLFMSGYTAEIIDQKGVLSDGLNFIQKPFGTRSLHDKIQQILAEEKPARVA